MDPRIKKAYGLIKSQYGEKLALNKLAAAVDLSPYYFQRLFKKEMRESPLECLNRIRLERAAHLMVIDPERPMAEIAYDCGFSSPSAFSRSFLQRFDQPPLDFAKELRKPSSEKLPPQTSTSQGLTITEPALVYFEGCWIVYAHTSVFWKNLLNTFDSVNAFCALEDIPISSEKRTGVFTHIHLAFGGATDHLNYYAGMQIPHGPKARYKLRAFRIPSGKYACFTTNTSYFDLFPLMVQFKESWMDKKSLKIRDTFTFESIAETAVSADYPCLSRRVFIPVL